MADFLEENNHLFRDVYRAKVVSITTDEDSRNRIRVRVLGLHSNKTLDDYEDGIPDNQCPLAEIMLPIFGGFSNDNNNISGISTIPSVGSWVFCIFENGNFNKPIIIGSVAGKNDFTDIDTDSPDEITTILSKSGHKVTINDKAGEEKIIIKSGINESIITIDDTSGSEKISIEENKNGNTITLNSSGISIEDKNGNTFEMITSKVTINGNLEILQ